MSMSDEDFNRCLDEQEKSNKNSSTPFWDDLAEELGFSSPESLRSKFKREKIKRGVVVGTQPPVTMPVVGIMDIEVLPMKFWGFAMFDQNFSPEQVDEHPALLSWAAKYINEPEIYSDILTSTEAKKRKDKRVTVSALKFLRTCDIVIGHNWRGYDGKMLNMFFLKHGLWPHHYSVVDTYLIAKQNFKFPSNSMKYINTVLGVTEKVDNEGFPLWKACARGEQDALDTMLEYNIGDILANEDNYHKFKPYVKGINAALWNEIETYQCGVPGCGSTNLVKEGFYTTTASRFESLRCQECGSVSRKPKNVLTPGKRKNTLRLV